MRAVRRVEDGIRVLEVPSPDAGADEVRVHVAAAAICGSDLHAISGGPLPNTLGHEVAGRLDDGSPVAIWPLTPCGRCDRCLAGEAQQCRGERPGASAQWDLYGFGRDGGMADEIVVRSNCLVPLPSSVPLGDACLVEPLACAVHAARRAALRPDDRVAVIGGGTMGLAFAAIARDLGCAVCVRARHPRQREAAEALGASLGAGGEYDLVVDAAGAGGSADEAVDLCRPGATLLLLATPHDGLHLAPLHFAMKEVVVVPASAHGRAQGCRDVDAAAMLLATWPDIAAALITHRMPLAEAADAFRVAGDRAAGSIKVVLEP